MTSPITTHVLDTALGRPAAGVAVSLEIEVSDGQWKELGQGKTDADGRISQLLAADDFAAGTYRLTFDTKSYFLARNVPDFYPRVTIVFTVRDAKEHYHIPLLLSPYGYSTYRGS
jgi:5-hydroxyisourate hydrolase